MMKRKGVLRDFIKRHVIEDIIRFSFAEQKPEDLRWKVLVLDHFSSKVVSSCCSMQDITTEGVTLVEDLHKNREPLPYLEAIYILKPCEESFDKLIKDVKSNPCIYKAFHLFFIEICPPQLFDKLCGAVRETQRVKNMKEVYMSYIPRENHAFTVEEIEKVNHRYFKEIGSTDEERTLQRIAEQLASFCASLGENPSIRYRSAFPKNESVAERLVQKLQEYAKVETNLGEGTDKARSELIILDRGFDCTSPLLHELTLEAMSYDIGKIHEGKYKGLSSSGEEKESFLDDNDELWSELKYMHIAEAMKKVSDDFKHFLETKNLTRGNEQKSLGLKELNLMVKKMPQCQKELNMYSTQVSLADDCLKAYERRIKKLCAVEQDLATGFNAEGERIKDIMSQINPILLDGDQSSVFTDYEKLRVIILHILSKNGVSEDALNRLLTHANINEDLKQIVMNVSLLGHTVVTSASKNTQQMERKDRDVEGVKRYTHSRWTPVLKDILEFAMEDRLDKKLFPYKSSRTLDGGYKAATSTRFNYGWHNQNRGAQPTRSIPRLMVFVVGGVTYSEIRSVYELNRMQGDWEVIIGSTELLTPDTFLSNLKELSA